jgi:glycosyltransferase involved in cell wall biosynthesis
MKQNKKSIWITWEKQIRNKSMSARLGADFFQVIDNSSRILRYCKCTLKTIKLLYFNRDKVVFVQNPSIVLSFVSVVFKKIFGITLVVDAHNSGVYPGKNLQFLANFINRNADYVIVTNEALAEFVRSLGGRAVVLPDPLPEIEVDKNVVSPWADVPQLSVMVICSWASDEPYTEIIGAAALLPNVTFYITGNSKGRELEYGSAIPSNLVLTGYIDENDYHVLLRSVAVIVDLTTRENCLVCGAYEAISVGKPLILSDTQALRAYFENEAVFVQNKSSDIAVEVEKMFVSYPDIAEKARVNSVEVEERWRKLYQKFYQQIFT